MNQKIRVAFVKFLGMSSGGTDQWLQIMATNLDPRRFAIDYYYCDAAPFLGSTIKTIDTAPDRLAYMAAHNINLIKFHVWAKDNRVQTHDWLNTDFWDVFDSSKYDFVQTGKAGPAEYPYFKLDLPVVELVALDGGVDKSPNIAWSIHPSPYQWVRWCQKGGNVNRSSVIPPPIEPPQTDTDLRQELEIPPNVVVAGFHQRTSDSIFSPIPLKAFAALENDNRYFIIKGSDKYRQQALELGLKNVRFLPPAVDGVRISAFLNTLDIFSHGRRDGETFGSVLAEAMMHGKCCLSHKSNHDNAQPETMGPAGFFAETEEEYLHYLETLFQDRELREAMGKKGKIHAEGFYSLNSNVIRLENLYESLAYLHSISHPFPKFHQPLLKVYTFYRLLLQQGFQTPFLCR
jgi:hypothetical protein